MLTEEECSACLNYQKLSPTVRKCFEQLIHEHFNNPPLKFEELETFIPYWDNKNKEWTYIIIKHEDKSINLKPIIDYEIVETITFEENRFYRKQVEE